MSTFDIYPYFVLEKNIVTIHCDIEFDVAARIERIIFVAGDKKLKLNINTSDQDIYVERNPKSYGIGSDVQMNVVLSKEQFYALFEMPKEKDIQCAVYTTKGACKLKQYSKRMNKLATDTLDYFNTNFADYIVVGGGSDITIE